MKNVLKYVLRVYYVLEMCSHCLKAVRSLRSIKKHSFSCEYIFNVLKDFSFFVKI